MVVHPPSFLQGKGFTAKEDRNYTDMLVNGEGVLEPGGYATSTTGATSTSTTAGHGMVRGDTNANQGLYEVWSDATTALTYILASAQPRLDQIVVRVRDNTEAGGGTDSGTVEVIAGAETAGCTLDTRSGVTTLPASAMLVADVLVPTSGSVTIRDRRSYAVPGIIPPIKTTTIDPHVSFMAAPPLIHAANSANTTGVNNIQYAGLVYLPRRIANATKLRTAYMQDIAGGMTGNVNIGIYDASGRQIVTTGVIALTGAGNTGQQISATITATTFEAGLYYIVVGFSTIAGTGPIYWMDAFVPGQRLAGGAQMGSICPNAFFGSTGGTTLTTTILAFTDVGAAAIATGSGTAYNIPNVSLATA